MLGLKNLNRWNRCAIVADSQIIQTLTNAVGAVVPGEFRGYAKAQYWEALSWTVGMNLPFAEWAFWRGRF